MKAAPLRTRGYRRGGAFTLVEMLVGTAVLLMVLVVLFSSVQSTAQLWSRTTAKVSEFQIARTAFERLTRNLSQATLNTYWQYDEPKPTDLSQIPSWRPTEFVRASDLHFVCGPAADTSLVGRSNLPNNELIYPTHCVFFQAPLGFTSVQDRGQLKLGPLDHLLTAMGYYIEWGTDDDKPDFITKLESSKARNRFRLMEARQPTENLAIYATRDASKFKTTAWIKMALGQTVTGLTQPTTSQPRPRAVAENVIALIILPKVADSALQSGKLTLAPTYRYDSRPANSTGTAYPWKAIKGRSPENQWFNQLPPILQVHVIAIDGKSASKFPATPPTWTKGLFPSGERIASMKDVEADLLTLETRLQKANVNYRLFSNDVTIRGAKWSAPAL